MTANLVLRMTTTGDESESEGGIQLGKGLKVAMFWLRVFGDLGMTKNNKGSILLLDQRMESYIIVTDDEAWEVGELRL